MYITNDIKYVGVNDHQTDFFEGHYNIPKGMAYNSYVIISGKICVMDSVDKDFSHQWLDNVGQVLSGRTPDFLVVHHMEPDHSSNILTFAKAYPDAKIVASEKAFEMMNNFFGVDFSDRRIIVKNGDSLDLGKHKLTFFSCPMVHWPEVMSSYDETDKVLFSADAFGKFGANDVEEPWDDEARRYFVGIVGKYGQQVQLLLDKLKTLEINAICSLHGPVLTGDLSHYIDLYDTWSSYRTEKEGIFIPYTSVYGNTKKAVQLMAEKLEEKGCPEVVTMDLARTDIAEAVAQAFKYGRIILATTTFNADIFPYMKEFINCLLERNFQNKTIGIIENGSWAPVAARTIKSMFEKSKNMHFLNNVVTIKSALNDESRAKLNDLADEITFDYKQREDSADKHDLTALFNIGYGLYVVTSNDGEKDNGLIVNTVTQLTSSPNRVAVNINKENYSHHVIKKTGILNVNCLSTEAPFKVFQDFGFRSGRTVDKFKGQDVLRSDNGLVFLSQYINSFMSLKVEQYVDLGTHGMFICSVTEARVMNKVDTMTYTYYQNNVKPKPKTEGKKGYVCKICGYVHEGDELPDDFICPLCKHGAQDFEPIQG